MAATLTWFGKTHASNDRLRFPASVSSPKVFNKNLGGGCAIVEASSLRGTTKLTEGGPDGKRILFAWRGPCGDVGTAARPEFFCGHTLTNFGPIDSVRPSIFAKRE